MSGEAKSMTEIAIKYMEDAISKLKDGSGMCRRITSTRDPVSGGVDVVLGLDVNYTINDRGVSLTIDWDEIEEDTG